MNIELECAVCGKFLDGEVDRNLITIEPCPACLEEEYERGIKDGEEM